MLTHSPHRVWTRARWADDWAEVPYLYADRFTFAASPTLPQAILSYRYGHIKRRDKGTFSYYPPLTNAKYVKIELLEDDAIGSVTRTWVGTVVDDARAGTGTLSDTSGRGGEQLLTAVGMEFLLAQQFVTRSVVMTRPAGGFKQPTLIERAIGFNLGSGDEFARRGRGNMDADGGAFTPDLERESHRWSTRDIVDYLLLQFSPRDFAEQAVIRFALDLDPRYRADALSFFHPQLMVEGRSIKELLDTLIERRRALAWKAALDSDDRTVRIQIFSFNRQELNLGNVTIAANPRVTDYLADQDRTVQALHLARSTINQYDQVVCRGERAGSCFTINYPDTLTKDWTVVEEIEYRIGASTEPTYSGQTQFVQQAMHDLARDRKKLRKVWRSFRLKEGWDGTIGGAVALPDPRSDNPTDPAKFWETGLRFHDALPLRVGVDYTAVDTQTGLEDPAQVRDDYLRPFVLLFDGARYQFLERLRSDDAGTLPETSGRDWSASYRMHEEAPGFELQIHGKPAHIVAKNEFFPIDNADTLEAQPDVSWRDFWATVYVLADGYCEARYPRDVDLLAGELIRRLWVDVPRARLEYLVPGTIVDVDAAGRPLLSSGGFIFDSRDYLARLAALIYAWYQAPRQIVELSIHQLNPTGFSQPFDVGTILGSVGTGISAELVDTVVSEISFDTRAGVCSLKTAFAELDWSRL